MSKIFAGLDMITINGDANWDLNYLAICPVGQIVSFPSGGEVEEFVAMGEWPSQFNEFDQTSALSEGPATLVTRNTPGLATLVIATVKQYSTDSGAPIQGDVPDGWSVVYYPNPAGSDNVMIYQIVYEPTTIVFEWPGTDGANQETVLTSFNSSIPQNIPSIFATSAGSTSQTVNFPSNNLDSSLLPSFALVGTYSTDGDTSLPPVANASAIPNPVAPNKSVFLVWTSTNIVQVSFTGNNGVDPVLNSGLIMTTGAGSGVYEISAGFTESITITFSAYDTTSHIAVTQAISLVIT